MTTKFNVGDTVKYTSPSGGQTILGVVKDVNPVFSDYKETGYLVEWNNNEKSWINSGNLSLESAGITTVSEAKEAKVALESEILRLIQDFNKKTDLEVQGISLDCYRAISAGYTYQVNVKVEI